MPRVYFTGRKKIARNEVSLHFRRGNPPEFEAKIDLSRYHRALPKTAKVFIEAYNNTSIQRFDFGTVADCRPRESLRLTNFDEWDDPYFRLRVVAVESQPGTILASCEHIDSIIPEAGGDGGKSLLKLYPKPNEMMQGELWKIQGVGNDFQLWYNKDVERVSHAIKSKFPDTLGLILPAAIREILARTLLWERDSVADPTEWTQFGQTISGIPVPTGEDGNPPSSEDLAEWIDGVVRTFCQDKARFVSRILDMEASRNEPASV